MIRILKGSLIFIAVFILGYSFFYPSVRDESGENLSVTKYESGIDPEDEILAHIKRKKEAPFDTFKFDNPNAFLDYHWGIRTRASEKYSGYLNGTIIQELNKAKANKYYQQYQAARTASLEFKERGPANVPGRTRAILVLQGDPANNTWLAGGVGGGIWKTLDGGQSWELKTPDIPSLAITWLANSSADPSIIYATTGEANGGGRGLKGNGVLKSTDGGESWIVLPSTLDRREFTYVGRIIVDNEDPNKLIVCTTQGEWENEFRSEIYKSTDGGENWAVKYDSDTWITQVIAHPSSFDTIYAAKWAGGVLKSTDNGETWEDSSLGMNKISGRVEIAIAPTDPDRLYASCQGNISGAGADLYVSFNAGNQWSIVDQEFENTPVDFFRGQGDYDNTIAVNPFNENEVYYGGVNLWKTEIGAGEGNLNLPVITVSISRDTSTFWDFVNFGAEYFKGRLSKGENLNSDDFKDVEIRTGNGKAQFAHRFIVNKEGSGVPDSAYFYEDYVIVPFEVWDIESNQQLMVSFRDQQEDGEFNLILQSSEEGQEEQHSREYIFIHDIAYSENPDPMVGQDGGDNIGHTYRQMYFFWPVLREDYEWQAEDLLEDTILIDFDMVNIVQRSGELLPVSDAYGDFVDDLNPAYIQNSSGFSFHPDHHNLVMIPVDKKNETFKILNSNDGGVYISNISQTPGINTGDWTLVANGYNTGQFYSVAKKPGEQVYIGGLQDNGTWKSPDGVQPNGATNYLSVWGGDGFDVLWHYLEPEKYIVSIYNNRFYRTDDNGESWYNAGIGINGIKPFFSKLASSPSTPDDIYTVSSLGVYRSENFGESWNLTSIDNNWGFSNFIDIKVSKSNSKIIWAGSGMTDELSVHVSTDGGLDFAKTNNFEAAELGFLSGMATHPYEDSTAYILFSFSLGPKILRTTDLGETWEDISGFDSGAESQNGFPDVAVYCLLVRPDDPQIIWAGTEIGIFESDDNGESWHFLDSKMGAVGVWDMIALDDEIVIATHGRGIFTATLPEAIEVLLNPVVKGYGTSIEGNLAIDLDLRSSFDSTIININGIDHLIESNQKGSFYIEISGLPVGDSLGVSIQSYKRGKAYLADFFDMEIFDVNEPVREYAQNFNDGTDDFVGEHFLITKFSGFDDFAIHTRHPYKEGQNFPGQYIDIVYQLRTPIVLDATNAQMVYDDIAIVETGEVGSSFPSTDFYDYVIVEGSKDGVHWLPLIDGYDASKNSKWLNAYDQRKDGDKSMFVTQSVDLLDTFNPEDTIFVRFRLYSDPLTAGWGWAIDNLYIQQEITSLEEIPISDFGIYPNPLSGDKELTIDYQIDLSSNVQISLINVNGVIVYRRNLGIKSPGKQIAEMNLNNLPAGIYLLELKSNRHSSLKKVIIN